MKKYTLIAFCFVLISLSAFAQKEDVFKFNEG